MRGRGKIAQVTEGVYKDKIALIYYSDQTKQQLKDKKVMAVVDGTKVLISMDKLKLVGFLD